MLDDLGETEPLKALKPLDEEHHEAYAERIFRFMSGRSIGGLSGVGVTEG